MQHDELPVHQTTGLRAVGLRKSGAPIWPILGAAEGDENGGQQGQQGTGQQQGQGQSLLEEQANQGQQQDGEQGGQQSGQQHQQDGAVNVADIVQQVTQALEGKFDSIADRRVNAILREVRQGQQGQGQQQGGNAGQQGQGQGGQQGQQQQPVDRTGDLREARLAYREYVADEIKFLGTEEREAAMTLAQASLMQKVAQGEDPDTAGREVAKTVAGQIKALRTHYESQTVAALQRRGALPKDGRGEGQPLAGGTNGGQTQAAGWQKGADRAAAMFPNRQPAQTP